MSYIISEAEARTLNKIGHGDMPSGEEHGSYNQISDLSSNHSNYKICETSKKLLLSFFVRKLTIIMNVVLKM